MHPWVGVNLHRSSGFDRISAVFAPLSWDQVKRANWKPQLCKITKDFKAPHIQCTWCRCFIQAKWKRVIWVVYMTCIIDILYLILQMHLTSCACRKSFNITNIQDFVIHAQVLWLACSVNSTINSPFCISTYLYIQVLYWKSSCFPRYSSTLQRFRAESRLCSCRPSWSCIKTFHLQRGTWGTQLHNKWKNDGQPHEPGSLKGFNLYTHKFQYLDWNLSKSLGKHFGPEHVSELSPHFWRIWCVFLDQSTLNVTIKPCPDQSKRLCVHVPPLVEPLNALRADSSFACMWQNSDFDRYQLLCFFFRHWFPLKWVSRLVSLQGKTRPCCKSNQ